MDAKASDATLLGVETSCDETAAAVVVNGRTVLSDVVLSQMDTHAMFGGVVPELAARLHIETIVRVVDQALKDAHTSPEALTAVAVTAGPGLIGALHVGVSFAKAFAYRYQKPLIAVHHLAGHIAANALDNPDVTPPYLALIASGGHCHIVKVDALDRFTVLATTRDDAAGEAFDKIGRALGLSYPAGPAIDRLAAQGQARLDLPHTRVGTTNDFSFSGFKTAVMQRLARADRHGERLSLEDIAASVQTAIADTLALHVARAIDETGARIIALSGGVAANSGVRDALSRLAQKQNVTLIWPTQRHCTDNAAMIAAAAYPLWRRRAFASLDLAAHASWSLDRRERCESNGQAPNSEACRSVSHCE